MAMIPPQFLNTVVSIGIGNAADKRTWIGTGFLYGLHVLPPENSGYQVCLVTNKHVLDKQETIWLTFNKSGGQGSTDYQIVLKSPSGENLWSHHTTEDVAAFWLNVSSLRQDGHNLVFFQSDQHTETLQQLKQRGATEGDGVFLLGFPMNLVGQERHHVICRMGCLARIQDMHEGLSTNYMVDAMVFPGNSGGPVLSKPESTFIRGTQTTRKATLMGIVQAYVPYTDVAVSMQTQRPRVVFEENSGLSIVLPVDFINEVVRLELVRQGISDS